MNDFPFKRVALVHDHLAQDGGAERVLQVLQKMFPKAPTYALVVDRKRANPAILSHEIRPSFIQKLPRGVRGYQWYLTLMPAAIEHWDFSEFDFVFSTSSSFAKGIITRPETLHVNYCHTPTRWLWTESQTYVRDLHKPRWVKGVIATVLPFLRQWDYAAAQRPQVMIANSQAVKRRIAHYYHRDVDVVPPPVALDQFEPADKIESYYLTGGRLVPYKRFDLTVKAFNQLGIPLKIFGDGPELSTLKKMARPNIEFVGRVLDADRGELYRKAVAFIHPQEEDAGITPVEAMASGRPVIAYRAGGATETVVDGVTGVFFNEQAWEVLADCVVTFDPSKFDSSAIRTHAMSFSEEAFRKRMQEKILSADALTSLSKPASIG